MRRRETIGERARKDDDEACFCAQNIKVGKKRRRLCFSCFGKISPLGKKSLICIFLPSLSPPTALFFACCRRRRSHPRSRPGGREASNLAYSLRGTKSPSLLFLLVAVTFVHFPPLLLSLLLLLPQKQQFRLDPGGIIMTQNQLIHTDTANSQDSSSSSFCSSRSSICSDHHHHHATHTHVCFTF